MSDSEENASYEPEASDDSSAQQSPSADASSAQQADSGYHGTPDLPLESDPLGDIVIGAVAGVATGVVSAAAAVGAAVATGAAVVGGVGLAAETAIGAAAHLVVGEVADFLGSTGEADHDASSVTSLETVDGGTSGEASETSVDVSDEGPNSRIDPGSSPDTTGGISSGPNQNYSPEN
jgi:hypothetical protein